MRGSTTARGLEIGCRRGCFGGSKAVFCLFFWIGWIFYGTFLWFFFLRFVGFLGGFYLFDRAIFGRLYGIFVYLLKTS